MSGGFARFWSKPMRATPGSATATSPWPPSISACRIWSFDRINRPRIEAARLEHGADVLVDHLRNDREIEAFLSTAKRH